MIKHYRRKNRECVLEINENRIILSEPRIQPFNKFLYRDKNDIFHFYYDTKIQYDTNFFYFLKLTEEEQKEWREEENEIPQHNWVTICEGFVYEFGAIHYLADCIDKIIKINPDEKGQKEFFIDRNGETLNDYISTYELSCEGLLHEDSYILKKEHIHYEKSYNMETEEYEKKDIYQYSIFISIGNESRYNTMGFRATNLSEKDLILIKEWSNDFMELAKEITQKTINKMFESERDEYDYDPAWFKNHIKEKYPEDFHKWKEIWIKLYSEDFIRKEYWNYVKGHEIKEPLFSKWSGEKVIAQDLIKNGIKDWEAYCKLIDFYNEYQRH